jgi:ribosomal protein S19E (S16A)
MQKLTFREYRTRRAWLRNQYDNPDRSDWYLMQIASEIKIQRTRKSVDIQSMKLPFGTGKSKEKSAEEATIWSKMRWGALLQKVGINKGRQ